MHDVGLLAPVRAGSPIVVGLSDAAWVNAMLEVEAALAAVQAQFGIIPDTAAIDIADTVQRHEFDVAQIAIDSRGAANPVVVLVQELTRAVAHTSEASSAYVHRGSTSQDILDTATSLVTLRACNVIAAGLDEIATTLADLADVHRHAVMPGRTLAMHAVPITFGLKAANWLQGVIDAQDRLDSLRASGLPVQLGGAAGTLASYRECASLSESFDAPIETLGAEMTVALANRLGLTTPAAPWHTIRTPLTDTASAMIAVSGVLGKIAVDVLSLTRSEVLEATEPTAVGRGESSAMPQKRNPTLSTLVRSAALQVPALSSIVFQAMLAEDERPAGAWHSEWQPLREILILVGGATETAVELVSGIEPDPARMQINIGITGGAVVSERLSMVLAPKLGKLESKKLLQNAAFESASRSIPLLDILVEDDQLRELLSIEEIQQLLEPRNYLGDTSNIIDRIVSRHARRR